MYIRSIISFLTWLHSESYVTETLKVKQLPQPKKVIPVFSERHLDEVGEPALSSQAKLLRVLQEYSIRTVGGLTEIPVNVRIIAATNKDLAQEILTS